jgi:micrococcal nuclease
MRRVSTTGKRTLHRTFFVAALFLLLALPALADVMVIFINADPAAVPTPTPEPTWTPSPPITYTIGREEPTATLTPTIPTATTTPTHTVTPEPSATPTHSLSAIHLPIVIRGGLPTPTATTEPLFLVTDIIDGDTIDVQTGWTVYRVRYIGIDAPESGACYFDEAKNKNAELVLGQWVRLAKDVSETDQSGRLLRYVYVGDTFVNYEMVSQGYALASTYPPDVTYADLFSQAQQDARDAGRGLWSGCATPTPTATWTPVPSCRIRDDFSDESSGWPVTDETHYHLAYLSGEYQVLLKTAPRWVGIAPGFLCVDCAVDLEGRFASDAYGAYGILFGVTDEWNGYFFRVTGDQRYSLYTMVDTYESQPLVDWTFSSAIHAGGTPNHLRVVRGGAGIMLYANGNLLSTLDDATYMGNLRVGLTAESYEQAGVDARFDNFALCDAALDATSITAASANPAMAGGMVMSNLGCVQKRTSTQTPTLAPTATP